MSSKRLGIAYFPTLGFNFIAIPKNGTTSFLAACLQTTIPNIVKSNSYHAGVNLHQKTNVNYINRQDSLTNGFTNITILRCPISRFTSQYIDFCYGAKNIYHNMSGKKSFKKDWKIFSSLAKKKPKDFFNLLTSHEDKDLDVHFRSQTWFVKYLDGCNDTFFFTTEKFSKGIKDINYNFNLDLQYYKKNITASYTQQNISLHTSLEDQILEYYQQDFIRWRTHNEFT